MKNKICYVVTVPVTIRAFFIPQLKYLSKHGYDVTVICSDDKKIEAELGDLIIIKEKFGEIHYDLNWDIVIRILYMDL